jgi:hypothetical protein
MMVCHGVFGGGMHASGILVVSTPSVAGEAEQDASTCAHRINMKNRGSDAVNCKEAVFNVPVLIDIFLQYQKFRTKPNKYKNELPP